MKAVTVSRATFAVDPAMAVYYRTWGGRAITFGPLVDPEIVALCAAGLRFRDEGYGFLYFGVE